MKTDCVSKTSFDPKLYAGLREENRRLRQELFNLRVSTNGCGICDSCEVNYTTPGVSISAGYDLTFTWASIAGQTFKIESTTDLETWTELEAEYPAYTTTTTYTAPTLTPDGAPIYYRITELPIVYNECP